MTVTNTGDVAGEEVVQLYIHDRVGSVSRPVKELKGFRKIHLEPGEQTVVEFVVGKKQLSFLRRDMTWGTEPGGFDLFIGSNSRDIKRSDFLLLN